MHQVLVFFVCVLFHFGIGNSYIAHQLQKSKSILYAVKPKKKKKQTKLVDITVSSDNEIGKKGEIKRVKLSHAFNYIIPQKLGYRSTMKELVDNEKKEKFGKYINEVQSSFIYDLKNTLDNLIIPFYFKKEEKFVITQEDIANYLLTKGFIRDRDDVCEKIKSRKTKFSKFGNYPIKYTFLNNITIDIVVHIIEQV